MTTEQKAKAYDQVREKIALRFGSNVAEEIFSKFEESEDERIRKAIGYAIGQSTHSDGTLINGVSSEEALTWLEKQGDKTAWSEDDENRVNRLIAYFEDKESFTAEDDVVYANWLKSLRPQSQWKPSDEQMGALRDAIVYVEGCNSTFKGSGSVLEKLYNDLKKLREE